MKGKSKIEQLALEVAAGEIGDNFMNAARYFSKIQDEIPDKFSYLAKLTGTGLRKAYYLAAIDKRFRNLGVDRSRLAKIGWTKVLLISEYITEANCEQLLKLAETSTARELSLTWLRTIVSPFEVIVCDRVCAHGGVGEDGDHGDEIGAVVEAPLELGEVARDVLAAHSPVGPDDGALDVAEDGVDRRESRVASGSVAFAGDDDLMREPGVDDASEAR